TPVAVTPCGAPAVAGAQRSRLLRTGAVAIVGGGVVPGRDRVLPRPVPCGALGPPGAGGRFRPLDRPRAPVSQPDPAGEGRPDPEARPMDAAVPTAPGGLGAARGTDPPCVSLAGARRRPSPGHGPVQGIGRLRQNPRLGRTGPADG